MTKDGRGLGDDFHPVLEIRPRVVAIMEDGKIARFISDIPIRGYVIDEDEGGITQPEVKADRHETDEAIKKEVFK